jgi:CBS domain-containing protein
MREHVDFLGAQPPYDALDSTDLEQLAAAVEVEFFLQGTMIARADEGRSRYFYVIRAGEVEILDRGRLVDVLGPGETVGHLSVLSGMAPPLSARAVEDTVCYRLPDPRGILSHPERLVFRNYGARAARDRLVQSGIASESLRSVRAKMRPPLWAPLGATIRDAARTMAEVNSSCILVPGGGTAGIVTDSDFRRAIARDALRADAPLSSIATFPARTISAESMVGDALLEMVESGVHHLVVTGNSDLPIGILRVADVASEDVRNPLVLRRSIDNATTLEELASVGERLPGSFAELYDTGVSGLHVSSLVSALVDALVSRIIELTPAGPGIDVGKTSWLLLGSLGRREPLPRSDVDTGLLWADSSPESNALHQGWAHRVLDNLERTGLRKCPDGANATNPLFGRPLAEATRAAGNWISNPLGEKAILMASLTVDMRPITGLGTGRSLTESLLEAPRTRDFHQALMRFTLSRRPPIGFVRDFVVEHSGAQKGRLDLKSLGMVPIASIGRWIALVTGNDRGSTVARLRRGVDAGLLSVDEADTLVGAFEHIHGLLLQHEVEALRDARRASTYINPRELGSLTRRQLREAFRAVADVQNVLEGEWAGRIP